MTASLAHVVIVGRRGPVASVFIDARTCLDEACALAKLAARSTRLSLYAPDDNFPWRLERGQR